LTGNAATTILFGHHLFDNDRTPPLIIPWFGPLQNSFCNGFKGGIFSVLVCLCFGESAMHLPFALIGPSIALQMPLAGFGPATLVQQSAQILQFFG